MWALPRSNVEKYTEDCTACSEKIKTKFMSVNQSISAKHVISWVFLSDRQTFFVEIESQNISLQHGQAIFIK